MCKSHKYFRNLLCLTFCTMNILFRAYFHQKISRKKLDKNLCRSGSGSGRFRKSDPDPVKNRPDPQHGILALCANHYTNAYLMKKLTNLYLVYLYVSYILIRYIKFCLSLSKGISSPLFSPHI
jgi:hypothetical protein